MYRCAKYEGRSISKYPPLSKIHKNGPILKNLRSKSSLRYFEFNKTNRNKIGLCAAEREPFERAEVLDAPAESARIWSPLQEKSFSAKASVVHHWRKIKEIFVE